MNSMFCPALSDLRFDAPAWTLHEDLADNRSWFTEQRDAVRFQLFRNAPGWPFDLQNYAGANAFFDEQSRSYGGAMLDLTIVSIQGLETLIGVFKYSAPIPQSLAMYYVGIIWVPFESFLFQINVEALEKGTTGLREAMVAVQENLQPDPNQQPIHVHSAEELFARMRESKVRKILSDDAKYDPLFPDHPLSKVRNLIRRTISTMTINPQLFAQKPYRIS